MAKLAIPKLKHKTILEWTENKDKKKKLEIEVWARVVYDLRDLKAKLAQYTTNDKSPTHFTFVPLGHPELTTVCKELSREQEALVYIVSVRDPSSVPFNDTNAKAQDYRRKGPGPERSNSSPRLPFPNAYCGRGCLYDRRT